MRDRQHYLGRLQSLESSRPDAYWREIERYLFPGPSRFDGDNGHERRPETSDWNNIHDNTATMALTTLQSGFMAGATSPARPWFRLQVPDPDLNDYPPVRDWLDDSTKRCLRVVRRSNTYRSLRSIYGELGAFGTGATICLPDYANVVHNYPVPVGQFCVAHDWRQKVDTFYRKFQMSAAAVVKEFGEENCSERVKSMAKQGGTRDKPIAICHAIEQRPDDERDYSRKDNLNMPWRSVYFEIGGDESKILREGGFDEFPVLVPRWDVLTSAYGIRCPGMIALGDIKQLQHQQLRKAQGIDYQVRPPQWIPASLKNREVDTVPGGIAYYEGQTPPGITSMWQVNTRLDHLLEDIVDVRGRINGAFFRNIFLMFDQVDTGKMTATEALQRESEKMLLLGPVMEQVHDELLDPLIQRVFTELFSKGGLLPPPKELLGMDLGVEFTSVFAQAQKASGAATLERFMGSIGQFVQLQPEILDKLDFDEYVDVFGDRLGIDGKIIRGGNDVAMIRRARNEANAAKEQAALMEQQAGTVNQLASASAQVPQQDVLNMFSGYGSPSPAEV